MDISAHNLNLLLITILAVVGLVCLIAVAKVNAFVSLTVAAIFVGLCAGLNPPEIVKAYTEGMGGTLSGIAAVVGLGTMLGKMLAESGGAEVVAKTLIAALGEKRLHWTMMLVGVIVGIPVWFTVGVVLLVPIVFTIVRETGVPLLRLAVPLVAGLSVAHGLVPPHPGPLVAIELLKADAGKTILYSLIVGVPAAIVAGPLLVGMLERRVPVAASASGPAVVSGSAGASARTSLPGFWLTLATILLPVILMLLASAADMTLPKTSRVRAWFDFLGSPLMAMLLAVLFSLYSFGIARGFNRQQLLKFTDECLGPVATVLLVVGAGGAFNKVLVYSGVTTAIGDSIKGVSLSPLVLGWLVAVFIRVATGSATVAITTASGILAPIAARTPGTNLELLVIAMGAGSIILSHLNDGGFWFVKEYLGLSVSQTLKTWTVVETVISVVALIFVLLLNRIV